MGQADDRRNRRRGPRNTSGTGLGFACVGLEVERGRQEAGAIGEGECQRLVIGGVTGRGLALVGVGGRGEERGGQMAGETGGGQRQTLKVWTAGGRGWEWVRVGGRVSACVGLGVCGEERDGQTAEEPY